MNCITGWNPFVTSINMNGTNDCIGYINKLTNFDVNDSLFISAGANGYNNTNYYLDDGNNVTPLTPGANAMSGILQYGGSTNLITYKNNDTNGLSGHITNGFNVAGYLSWGSHSALGLNYAVNSEINWTGNTSWFIIRSVESFNGRRYETDMGTFLQWFAPDGFGSTNYLSTPVGAVSSVDEPGVFSTTDALYFGLWQGNYSFAMCAWNSRKNPYLQAVGDPFIHK